jgi:cell division protein FtsN
MPTARRRPLASGRRQPLPNWLMLLLGLGLGISAVLAFELFSRHNAGLGGHLAGPDKTPPKAAAKPSEKTTDVPASKPKFDFYTILPETEIVLPERTARAQAKSPHPERSAAVADNGYYVLQAASYARFQEADELKARLALLGLEAHIQKVTIEGRGEYHRVRLGPYARLEDLDADAARLKAIGIEPLRLRIKRLSD